MSEEQEARAKLERWRTAITITQAIVAINMISIRTAKLTFANDPAAMPAVVNESICKATNMLHTGIADLENLLVDFFELSALFKFLTAEEKQEITETMQMGIALGEKLIVFSAEDSV